MYTPHLLILLYDYRSQNLHMHHNFHIFFHTFHKFVSDFNVSVTISVSIWSFVTSSFSVTFSLLSLTFCHLSSLSLAVIPVCSGPVHSEHQIRFAGRHQPAPPQPACHSERRPHPPGQNLFGRTVLHSWALSAHAALLYPGPQLRRRADGPAGLRDSLPSSSAPSAFHQSGRDAVPARTPALRHPSGSPRPPGTAL